MHAFLFRNASMPKAVSVAPPNGVAGGCYSTWRSIVHTVLPLLFQSRASSDKLRVLLLIRVHDAILRLRKRYQLVFRPSVRLPLNDYETTHTAIGYEIIHIIVAVTVSGYQPGIFRSQGSDNAC